MQPTRRAWLLVSLLAYLAGFAVLADRPLLLGGVVGLGAYLVSTQISAFRTFSRTADATIEVTLDQSETFVDAPIEVSLMVARQLPADSQLTVEVSVPPGCSVTDGTAEVTLSPGQPYLEHAFTITPELAGEYTLKAAHLDISDERSLFTERFEHDVGATLQVAPRQPQDVHVGRGGERDTTIFGDQRSPEAGPGLLPREIREYVAGDPVSRIDWNATARLGTPHVIETEAERTQHITVIVDHRASMADGNPGETKLDYAREVGLGVVAASEAAGNPVTLYTVGDEGVFRLDAGGGAAATGDYRTLQSRLADLVAGGPTANGFPTYGGDPSPVRTRPLMTDGSPFSNVVNAYRVGSEPLPSRDENPLTDAIHRMQTRSGSTGLTMLVTSDAERPAVREAVHAALADGDSDVVVFLAPTILFEPGSLADLDTAYERYLQFEGFRRDLENHERVRAFEVAPGDRLATILDRAHHQTDAH